LLNDLFAKIFSARTIAEIGTWFWMLAGFAFMAVEIVSGRAAALSLALAAMITGTVVVLAQNGTLSPLSLIWQAALCCALSLILMTWLRGRT
jgi:membrane protein implicated in regulation of membrane protease activity